ncbi:hypothetical protein CJ030_MR2G020053 [Morella rubra]|uniref:Uncharacterized protein n=1 Tax=Morella rubra TaxID=262757 RepID=A0A6A1WCH1_9ROSI|nr:hypothetical protein CJ030_MR2G020053 [Morella rubra]
MMKLWDNLAPWGAYERGSKTCMDTLTQVKAPDKTYLEAMKAIVLEVDMELARIVEPKAWSRRGKGKLRPRLNADKGGRVDIKIPRGEPSVVLRKKREWDEEMPLGQAVKKINLGSDKEEITQVTGQLQSTIQPLGNIKKKVTKHVANKGKSKKNRIRAVAGTWGGGFTYEIGLALVDEQQDDTTDYKEI